MRPLPRLSVLLALAVSPGCYHYDFELESPAQRAERGTLDRTLVRHKVRAPTYLNGFVGTGRLETARFCAHPVRTELRVTAVDVLVSLGTLLIYTPHTLYVTCATERTEGTAEPSPDRAADPLPGIAADTPDP